MKKINLLFILIFSLFFLTSCSVADKETVDDKFLITVTIFPEYDWIREITKDIPGIDVNLLLSNGTDMHSFQPTVQDIIYITDSDLFVYVGGESDFWADDILKNNNINSINLLDTLNFCLKTEEIKEGMENDDLEDESSTEFDEHVWLSLKNSIVCVNALRDELIELLPSYKEIIIDNSENYIRLLKDLDNRYSDMVLHSTFKTIVVADRFPFRYMVDDYSLDYYAAFPGCSSETEASFSTISFLSEKLDEINLNSICVIDKSDSKIAETVIKNSKRTDREIITIDSMQSVSKEDIENGITYLSIMENNLIQLKKALN